MISIAIIGASGRTGSRIVALARQQPDRFQVANEITRSNQRIDSPRVAIDFSAPESTRHWLELCRQRKIAMLIGTTGLSKDDHAAIDAAARDIAILQASNTSVGVAVLNKLVAEAVRMLPSDCDVDIVEAHHRFKKDKPSGTAMALAESVGRDTPTHSLRIGDEIGTHTVHFGLLGERLELTHRTTSRDTFAHGALRAAEWLAAQAPGRYSIADAFVMKKN